MTLYKRISGFYPPFKMYVENHPICKCMYSKYIYMYMLYRYNLPWQNQTLTQSAASTISDPFWSCSSFGYIGCPIILLEQIFVIWNVEILFFEFLQLWLDDLAEKYSIKIRIYDLDIINLTEVVSTSIYPTLYLS